MNEYKVSHHQKASLENAKKAKVFAGKRFLGFTPRGAEVWISMEMNRETKELKITTTHNLSSLLEEGAEFANRRVVVKKGSPNPRTAKDLLRKNQKNMGGQVTEGTILYLMKLINAVEMKYGDAYVKGEPTRLLFMYASNAIFEGGNDLENGEFGWSYVLKAWGLPQGGYFLVDNVPLAQEDVVING